MKDNNAEEPIAGISVPKELKGSLGELWITTAEKYMKETNEAARVSYSKDPAKVKELAEGMIEKLKKATWEAAIAKEFEAMPQKWLILEDGVWWACSSEYIDGKRIQTREAVTFDYCDCGCEEAEEGIEEDCNE